MWATFRMLVRTVMQNMPLWEAAFEAMNLGKIGPLVKPVLETIGRIKQDVDTLETNKKEFQNLHHKCIKTTEQAIALSKANHTSEYVRPLEICVNEVFYLVEHCKHQRWYNPASWTFTSYETKISRMSAKLDRVIAVTTLKRMAVVEAKVDGLAHAVVSRFGWAPGRGQLFWA